MGELPRIGVVGLGNMGLKHVKTCAEHPECQLVASCTRTPSRRRQVEAERGIKTVADYRELVGMVDAVIVAVPNHLHFEVASFFLRRRIHVLLEKPMTPTLDEAKRLVAIAEESPAVLQIGHVERFNPAWRAGLRWWQQEVGRPPEYIEAHRLGPPPGRPMQTGVVLDLMIHDIDLVLSLWGEMPSEVAAQALSLAIWPGRGKGESKEASVPWQGQGGGGPARQDALEDLCIATLRWPDGRRARLAADRFAHDRVRSICLATESETLYVDLLGRRAAGFRGKGSVKVEVPRSLPLDGQLSSFVAAVNGGTAEVGPEDGRRVLEVCHDVLCTGSRKDPGPA